MLLSSALRRDDLEQAQEAMREAVEQIESEIANLRAIITELRPAALDELGLRTAIEALLDRHREQSGFEIDGELALPGPSTSDERLIEDLETAVYRLVQEALTNVAKHARANHVRVVVREPGTELLIEVQDDGVGFDMQDHQRGLRSGRHAGARRASAGGEAERRVRPAGNAAYGPSAGAPARSIRADRRDYGSAGSLSRLLPSEQRVPQPA